MRRLHFQVTGIDRTDLRDWENLLRRPRHPFLLLAGTLALLMALQAVSPPRRAEPRPGWLQGVVRAGTPLDLVIVFDTTGSMSAALNPMRNSTVEIVRRLQEWTGDLRLGLVSFRDQLAGADGAFLVSPLSADTEARIGVLKGWGLGGGGDTPEDLYAGLRRALAMPWRERDASGRRVARIIIAVTDAPPHDPDFEGNTAESIARLARDRGDVLIFSIIVGEDQEAAAAAQRLAALTNGQSLAADDPAAALLSAVQP